MMQKEGSGKNVSALVFFVFVVNVKVSAVPLRAKQIKLNPKVFYNHDVTDRTHFEDKRLFRVEYAEDHKNVV